MEGLLLSCLEVSLGAALVIAFMLLLARLAGKHFTAKWRYWMWLALVLRLLLPFNIHLTPAPIQVQMPEQELTFAEEQLQKIHSGFAGILGQKEYYQKSWGSPHVYRQTVEIKNSPQNSLNFDFFCGILIKLSGGGWVLVCPLVFKTSNCS